MFVHILVLYVILLKLAKYTYFHNRSINIFTIFKSLSGFLSSTGIFCHLPVLFLMAKIHIDIVLNKIYIFYS